MKHGWMIVGMAVACLALPTGARAGQGEYQANEWIRHQDVDGGRDAAGISRFEGSLIQYYKVSRWDRYTLPVSRLESVDGQKRWADPLKLEGQVTRLQYSVEKENNPAFVQHNYVEALAGADWKILFQGCGEQELGQDPYEWWFAYFGEEGIGNGRFGSAFDPRGQDHCYLAARRDDALGTTYAAIYTVAYKEESKGLAFTLITQDVIDVKRAGTGLVEAKGLDGELRKTGRVAIYGIHFDTGKAELKPSSDGTLEQIASLLSARPDLMLYVVGHTDDSGGFANNMELSRARAAAVVGALVQRYQVASRRLQPAGVGPLSPVATNATERGRALNRRVELVVSSHPATATTVSTRAPSRSHRAAVPDAEIKIEAAQVAAGDHAPAGSAPGAAAEGNQAAPPAPPQEQIKEEKTIPVPPVIGMMKLKATKTLSRLGFKVVTRGRKVGLVSAQSPAANTRAPRGSTVTITIGR